MWHDEFEPDLDNPPLPAPALEWDNAPERLEMSDPVRLQALTCVLRTSIAQPADAQWLIDVSHLSDVARVDRGM